MSHLIPRQPGPTCSDRVLPGRAPVKKFGPLLALIGTLLLPSLVRSDALVITMAMNATSVAEFFIEDDGVTVELEIGVVDLMGFKDLLPDEIYEVLMRTTSGAEGGVGSEVEAGLEPLEDRLPRFFRDDLRIVPDAGQPIVGRVLEVEASRRLPRDQVTGDPLPVGPDYEGERRWCMAPS